MNDEVWVIGATGRTGRAIAARLHMAEDDLVLSHAVGVGKQHDRAAQGAFHQPSGALRLVLCPAPEVVTYQAATALPVRVCGRDRIGLRTTLDLRECVPCAQQTVVSR